MNPQPSDLESDALAVRATGLYPINANFKFKNAESMILFILNLAFFILNFKLCLCLLMHRMLHTGPAIFFPLEFIGSVLFVLHSRIILAFALRTLKKYYVSHAITSVTTPAPTVRPPSLMANLSSFSIAIGDINSTDRLTLSPGITISTPSGNCATPVTSVVLK